MADVLVTLEGLTFLLGFTNPPVPTYEPRSRPVESQWGVTPDDCDRHGLLGLVLVTRIKLSKVNKFPQGRCTSTQVHPKGNADRAFALYSLV